MRDQWEDGEPVGAVVTAVILTIAAVGTAIFLALLIGLFSRLCGG